MKGGRKPKPRRGSEGGGSWERAAGALGEGTRPKATLPLESERPQPTGDSKETRELCVEEAQVLPMVGSFPQMGAARLPSSQPPSALVAQMFVVLHLEPEDLGSDLGS